MTSTLAKIVYFSPSNKISFFFFIKRISQHYVIVFKFVPFITLTTFLKNYNLTLKLYSKKTEEFTEKL